MRITPTRAIVCMWLLCSVWLPGIWWLQRLLAVPGKAQPHADLTVLTGGLVLLLLAALFLALSLRIEQARLRMAVRAVLRGEATAETGAEWRGVLDDVRLAMRRVGLERERLALRAQQAEDALREQGAQASRAAQAAALSLQQAQQEWRQLLQLLPSANQARQRLQTLQQVAHQVDAVQGEARQLRVGLEESESALRGLHAALGDLGGRTRREFHRRAMHLAQSLQLLSLNFRVVLERLELLPGVRVEGLDSLVQDLEPLCVQATSLLQEMSETNASEDENDGEIAARLQPLQQAVQALAGRVADVCGGLERTHVALAELLPQEQEAATRDLRGLLEKSLEATPVAAQAA